MTTNFYIARKHFVTPEMDDAIYGMIINKLCRLFGVKTVKLQKKLSKDTRWSFQKKNLKIVTLEIVDNSYEIWKDF